MSIDSARVQGTLQRQDARTLGLLALVLALVTATTWRRWGWPSFDAGSDLTVADLIVHGGQPYSDIRYYYGPLGLYALAGTFRVFGTNLTVAFCFGFAQTIAILGAFYALARSWLSAALAGMATLVMLFVAFSGTFFDFVLPHTNAGTFGCLSILAMLLAITRGRYLLAGLAAGAALLTRPEIAIFAAAGIVGAVLGNARESGWRAALRPALQMVLPALALGGGVLVYFAAQAGLHRVLFENIFPTQFVRVSAGRLEGDWAPLNASAMLATLARGFAVALPITGLMASFQLAADRHGAARLRAFWPLVAALCAVVALYLAVRVTGAFPGSRANLEEEASRLLIATSWLPVAALLALAWTARRALRGEAALGVGWPADLALVVTAAACALRAYNRFSVDSSAPYFAAPVVLVAAVALDRLARRWPHTRPAVYVTLGMMAAALSLHAYVGLYRDDTTLVSTPRGSYRTTAQAATGVKGTIAYLDRHSHTRAPLVVFPDDPGMYFLSNRTSALYDITFIPGSLSAAEERAAIARLRRARPPFIIEGAQRLSQYASRHIGADYNLILYAYVRRAYRTAASFGDVAHPTRNNQPAEAFYVYGLRTRP